MRTSKTFSILFWVYAPERCHIAGIANKTLMHYTHCWVFVLYFSIISFRYRIFLFGTSYISITAPSFL